MRKKLLLLLMIGSLFLPMVAKASTYYDDYATKNLVGALEEESIELENKNYKEKDGQVIIYVFRGNGCGFCRSLLTYLSSLTKEYGDYFRVVSFEVWNDAANSALMSKVATVTGVAAEGVPYYIIGSQTFDGYNDTYNDKIVSAIMSEYQNPTEDVFEKLAAQEGGSSKASSGDTFAIVFWNLVIVGAATGIIVYFMNKNKKEILDVVCDVKRYDNKKSKGKEKE